MKLSALFAVLATVFWTMATVHARDSNARRFARGLPPLPPRKRHYKRHRSQTQGADPSTPSNTPGNQCNTGSAQCCNSITNSGNPLVSIILEELGVILSPSTQVGVTCSPLGSQCNQHPVCCQSNHFNGFIAVGCTNINLL